LGRKLTNRQLMAVTPTGRTAITLYQVKQTFRQFNFAKLNQLVSQLSTQQFQLKKRDFEKLYQGFSLIKVTLKTGRTHQIRAHFTHLKHPLVGDSAYLSRKKAKFDQFWCPRQFLHAASLELTHPITQKKLAFTSPLPTDLEQVLTFLD
jgi:23S rRNA pseudouridine1911/1915/1917 synthase